MKRDPSVQNHRHIAGFFTVQYDVASNHYLTVSCFTKTSLHCCSANSYLGQVVRSSARSS
jgi:hypothetical protein